MRGEKLVSPIVPPGRMHGTSPLNSPLPQYGSSYSSPDLNEDSRPLLPRPISIPSSPTSPSLPSPSLRSKAPRLLPARRRFGALLFLIVLVICIGAWLQKDETARSSLISLSDKWGTHLGAVTHFEPGDNDWDDTTQVETSTNVESSPPKEPSSQPLSSSSTPAHKTDTRPATEEDDTDAPGALDDAEDSTDTKAAVLLQNDDDNSKNNDGQSATTGDDNDASPSTATTSKTTDDDNVTTTEEDNEEDTTQDALVDQIASSPKLNVRPFPRDPPRDPEAAKAKRYLAFDNHSGFHNQRKSIVNALLLAKMLNRTLLLPPVRIGYAVAWGPDVWKRILHDEECKAGLEPSERSLTPCANAGLDKWTYVAWSYIIQPQLTETRDIVDRWNSSVTWFYETPENGGLGLTEEEIYTFPDPDRRTWQIYDETSTPTNLGPFSRRMNLEELQTGEVGEARLIRFGSLFSGSRLVITKPENNAEKKALDNDMILQQPLLDTIADRVRDKLGSYNACHLRVGDGYFSSHSVTIMQGVFRKATKSMFNLRQVDITALLDKTEARLGLMSKSKAAEAEQAAKDAPEEQGSKLAKRSLSDVYSWHGIGEEDNDPDEVELELEADDGSDTEPLLIMPPARSRRSKRSSSSSHFQKRAPMASTLKCRRELHTDAHLLPLNKPVYIATDSRRPLKDAALAPFFDNYPCAFLLSDFAKENEISSEPVPELVSLVKGDLKSDWDGQNLASYFFGFLEAEIAARGIKVTGTPGSTFSGYAQGILHRTYVKKGIAATA